MSTKTSLKLANTSGAFVDEQQFLVGRLGYLLAGIAVQVNIRFRFSTGFFLRIPLFRTGEHFLLTLGRCEVSCVPFLHQPTIAPRPGSWVEDCQQSEHNSS